MAGIPIEMVPQFPADSKTILLTEAAKYDLNIVDKIKRQLSRGQIGRHHDAAC